MNEEIIFAICTNDQKIFINHIFGSGKREKTIEHLSFRKSNIITLDFNFYKIVESPIFGYALFSRTVLSQQETKEERKAFIPITQITSIFFLELEELEEEEKNLLSLWNSF